MSPSKASRDDADGAVLERDQRGDHVLYLDGVALGGYPADYRPHGANQVLEQVLNAPGRPHADIEARPKIGKVVLVTHANGFDYVAGRLIAATCAKQEIRQCPEEVLINPTRARIDVPIASHLCHTRASRPAGGPA
jgi:hypothetical protein